MQRIGWSTSAVLGGRHDPYSVVDMLRFMQGDRAVLESQMLIMGNDENLWLVENAHTSLSTLAAKPFSASAVKQSVGELMAIPRAMTA